MECLVSFIIIYCFPSAESLIDLAECALFDAKKAEKGRVIIL